MFYPIAQIGLKTHTAQDKSANATEEYAADDINHRCLQTERAEEHGYRYLVDQRRGDKECQCHTKRYATFHKTDEERYGWAGAERGYCPEDWRQQILEPIKAVADTL